MFVSPSVTPRVSRRAVVRLAVRLTAPITAAAAVGLPALTLGAAVTAGAFTAGAVLTAAPASAATLPHPTLVPESPAAGYPVISQAAGAATPYVGAADQAGRYVVAGGNFLQVTLQDGTIEPQPYLAVWNIDTKQLVCKGVTVNGEVTAVEPGPTADTVYVGGNFTKITEPDGTVRTRTRLARLRLPDCTVDLTFAAPGPSAVVTDLVRTGNRLFVAGQFTKLGTTARAYLAEVNATTGALSPSFSFPLTRVGTQVAIQGIGVNPAGTRLVVGGNLTGSFTRVFDITDPAAPRMTAHSSTGYKVRSTAKVTDAGVSPDGTQIGLAFAAGDANDYVALTPTTEQAAVTPLWHHWMRDSPFSVAISNNAMYVGGHFCKPDAGPGPTDVMSVWPGTADTCSGTNYAGGAFRSHLAALSLTDGTPLTWNPGNDSQHGATSLTVTSRGLLVGSDGTRMHSVKTGPLSYLDLGRAAEDVTPPSDVTITAPAAGATLGNPARISGTATDNLEVGTVKVVVKAANGKYVTSTGTLGTTPVTFTAVAANGSFSLDVPIKVAGGYTATVTAVDLGGLESVNAATVSFTDTALDTSGPTLTLPGATTLYATAGGTLSGSFGDNFGVTSLALRATDAAGQYLQPDGTLAATPADLPLTTSVPLPAKAGTWSAAVTAAVPAGSYTVTATATDTAGNVTTVTGTLAVVTGWKGEYFANNALTGTPALTRIDADINVDFGTGAPATGLPVDNFSIRWSRTVTMADAGTYTFSAGADDGVRLYVDGTKVVDSWIATAYAVRTVNVPLTAGSHTVVMEYNDLGGSARATLAWAVIPASVCPATVTGFKGEYFPNATLSGGAVLCRDDAAVNFDYANGAPAAGLPVDNFSVRWTKTQDFAAGTYTFSAGADDGVRLYVDGTKVVDSWISTPYLVRTVSVPLTAGSHTVVMEYNETGGPGRATLGWTQTA